MAAAASGGSAASAAAITSRGGATAIKATKTREGGGFIVRRAIGGRGFIDPFLMFDHFGPVVSKPGEAVGAPDHPHRGQTTVSYMLSGEMEHKDSKGNTGKLGTGWVQWMDAASGVIHSEMPSEAFQRTGGTMEGFQIWVNLRKEDKKKEPRYQDVPPESIPTVPVVGAKSDKSQVKVIAGASCGITGPVVTRTPIIYLDVHLQPEDTFEQPVPADHNVIIYVYRGKGHFGADNEAASESTMLSFDAEKAGKSGATGVSLRAAADSEMRCIFLAGTPLKEPVVSYGPFVMNTEEEIAQAFEDYRRGRFTEIEGAAERRALTAKAAAAQKDSGTWAAGDKEL